jgi:hypothetical protein
MEYHGPKQKKLSPSFFNTEFIVIHGIDGEIITINDVEEIEAIILTEDCSDSKRLEALNDYNTLAETLSIISRDIDDNIDNNDNINKKSTYVFTPTEEYDTEHFMKELEKQLTKMEPEEKRQSGQRESAQRESAQRQSAQIERANIS